jgi:hypothetical protein
MYDCTTVPDLTKSFCLDRSHDQAGLEFWGTGGRTKQPRRAGLESLLCLLIVIRPRKTRSGNQKRERLGGSGHGIRVVGRAVLDRVMTRHEGGRVGVCDPSHALAAAGKLYKMVM